MNTLSFDTDASGNWGYRIGGADSVIPFKKPSSTKAYSGSKTWNPFPTSSGGSASTYITFPEPFDTVPTIWVKSSHPTFITASYNNVSVSGFTLIGNDTWGGGNTGTISWCAFVT